MKDKTIEQLKKEISELRKRICELEKSEDALKESEHKCKVLANNVPSWFSYIDSNLKYQFVNDEYVKAFGIKKEEIIGKHISSILGDKTFKQMKPYFMKALSGEEIRTQQELKEHKYGSRWLDIILVPDIENGKTKGFYALTHNITDIKKAEAELRFERDFNENLIATSPAFFVIIDAQYKTVMMNESMLKSLGYSTSEVQGKDYLADFIPERDHEEVREIFRKVLHKKETTVNENSVATKDGRELLVEWHGCPILYEEGEVDMFFGVGIDITERKKAEEEREKIEIQFRSFGDYFPAFIYIKNSELEHIYANRNILELAQKSLDEIIGTTSHDLFPAEIAQRLEKSDRLVLDEKRPSYLEFSFINPAGNVKWMQDIKFPIEKPDGDIMLGGIAIDITERKQAEEALRDSETKLHAIFDHHYQLTGLIDPQGRLLAANRTALEFSGVDESDVIGLYFWDTPWWDPSQESKVRDIVERAARGEFVRIETTHPDKEGEIRQIDFSLSPVKDDDGNVIYLVPEGRDITEIKQSEKALYESEKRFRTIFEKAPIGIALVDMDGHFLFSNSILQTMVGYKDNELSQMDFADIVHPEDIDADMEFFTELITGKRDSYQIEERYIRKDGEIGWGNLRVALIKGEKEEPEAVIGMISDITQRKEAEQVIEEAHNRLQNLAKKVLTTQEEERQRISRELHDESGGMLTALNLKLDLISAELPPEQKTTRTQLADAKKLVNQTMDGLRSLASGLRPPALESFGLETTLEDLCQDFSSRTGLHIDYHTASVPVLPEIVQVTLYRVLQEGLTNIIKHAQANRVEVRFQHKTQAVVLSIEDDGIGFDPTTVGQHGMGLESMSERLELVGGKLEIQSQPGEGTRLTASIPVPK